MLNKLWPLCLGAAIACGSDPAPVVVPTALAVHWEILPHRLSVGEITAATSGDTLVVGAQWDGGAFGAVDTPWVTYEVALWRSEQVAMEEVSVTVEIAPGSELAGVPFMASEEVTVDAGSLRGATAVVALIRGYRISTDDYGEPPDFASDPDLPYDPAEGYTTQGLGIALGDAVLAADMVTVPVTVRNTLGISDRGDMNAAIPQATTWIRVDITLIGSFATGATALSAATSYFISSADYGNETVHEPAPPSQQRVEFAGTPGLGAALFGLRAIEYWLNVDGHHDPSCVVVEDAINSWGEEISGPGRYVRDLSARLHDTDYDASTGVGVAHAELMLSNSSLAKEVGNLCLGVTAEVTMLQIDDDGAATTLDPVVIELYPSELGTVEVKL